MRFCFSDESQARTKRLFSSCFFCSSSSWFFLWGGKGNQHKLYHPICWQQAHTNLVNDGLRTILFLLLLFRLLQNKVNMDIFILIIFFCSHIIFSTHLLLLDALDSHGVDLVGHVNVVLAEAPERHEQLGRDALPHLTVMSGVWVTRKLSLLIVAVL